MRICILANSVGFKIRPLRAADGDATFGELFGRTGHQVFNISRAGVTLHEHFATLDDEVITRFPDAVIINHGIIEAYPRRTFRSLNNAAIRNYYLNRNFSAPYRFRTGIGTAKLLLLNVINGCIRRGARLLGLHWKWQATDRFMEVLDACCQRLVKDTGAIVVVMGLPPPSRRAREEFPDFPGEVVALNAALHAYCQRLPRRLRYADVESMIAELPLEDAVPDGIHFSAVAHRLVFDGLFRILGDAGNKGC